MTELPKKAFEEASNLPLHEQDAFAALVLAERETEKQWDRAFAERHRALEAMEREAFDDLRAGRTDLLDPEALSSLYQILSGRISERPRQPWRLQQITPHLLDPT